MARTQGIVKSVRIDQEAGMTVLRLVLEADDVRIPVEMRGHKVKGVVEVGDEVTIEGAEGRDPDGVMRPKEVVNDSTQSTVTAEKRGFKARFSGVFVSLGLSIASGLGNTVIARVLVPAKRSLAVSATQCRRPPFLPRRSCLS